MHRLHPDFVGAGLAFRRLLSAGDDDRTRMAHEFAEACCTLVDAVRDYTALTVTGGSDTIDDDAIVAEAPMPPLRDPDTPRFYERSLNLAEQLEQWLSSLAVGTKLVKTMAGWAITDTPKPDHIHDFSEFHDGRHRCTFPGCYAWYS